VIRSVLDKTLWGLLLVGGALFSCGGGAQVQETPLPDQPSRSLAEERTVAGGLADAIHSLLQIGTPGSLNKALDLISSNRLEKGNFGRIMSAVAVTLLERLYPDTDFRFSPTDPPLADTYTKILKNAEQGIYTPPPEGSQDYLELVLPSLVLLRTQAVPNRELLSAALLDLERGRNLNTRSVLAPYFMGRIHEQVGEIGSAIQFYTEAYDLDRECYPAVLGIARILSAEGRFEEGIDLLSELEIRYPDNLTVKRQLALAYYNTRDWVKAESVVADILRVDSWDRQSILMQAAILVEQGQYLQAQAPLELYGSMDPANRRYLFLRARVQAEGYHNRESALAYLRSMLRNFQNSSPDTLNKDDEDILIYSAELLMKSFREEDRTEGRSLLNRLINTGNPSLQVVSLALRDVIRRLAWEEAQPFLNRLLAERRSPEDLLYAYQVERGLGNNTTALSYARELYEQDPRNDEGSIAYISALIDANRRSEASWVLENRLSETAGVTSKGHYYFLRSRLQNSEEGRINDLRSSLFEDPRNINALIAMFEIYHRRTDQRRAVYYLKQALALDPDNPRLKSYEAEYGDLIY
jgi:cytochrome c-type biogenesis protein CcmH/NrfG